MSGHVLGQVILALKIYPSHMGIRTPSNHGFLGLPESTSRTASRPVQPLLRGSQSWQTNRPTDHTVAIGRIYVMLQCGLKTGQFRTVRAIGWWHWNSERHFDGT